LIRRLRPSPALSLIGALLLAALPALAQAPRPAPGTTASPEMDVIEVSAERTGPRMWKLTREGDTAHVVWILGTLSPLPRRFQWQTDAVEAVLARSQELIPDGPGDGLHFGPIMAVRLYLQWRKTRANADHATLQQTIRRRSTPASKPRRCALLHVKILLRACARWSPGRGCSIGRSRPRACRAG